MEQRYLKRVVVQYAKAGLSLSSIKPQNTAGNIGKATRVSYNQIKRHICRRMERLDGKKRGRNKTTY